VLALFPFNLFHRKILFSGLVLLIGSAAPNCTLASPYIEAGTSLGTYTSGESLTEQTIGTPGLGFVGSLSLYFPVTSLKNAMHFELGLQNRLNFVNGSSASPMVVTPNLSARFEFWRMFVGAGYAPIVLVGTRPMHGSTSYFFEGGLIWRVIPEFQICAAVGLEYGQPARGGTSPSPGTEYGLRFRFPLDPKEFGSSRGVDFDGHRYPFGIMR
jgi:hypothetical protein